MEAIDKSISILENDIKEVEKLLTFSKRDHVMKLLNSYKSTLEQSLKLEKKNYEKNTEKLSLLSEKKDKSKDYVHIDKFGWLDSKATSKVYITDNFENLDGHDKSNIAVDFRKDEFEVFIHNWKGKNWRFLKKDLVAEINPETSYFKLNKSGMTIFLKKVKEDPWYRLNN
jgi:hypothetical protein